MTIKGKKILITGGAGFIGVSLMERLIEHNKVYIYDTLMENALKLTDFAKHKNLIFIKGDVLDAAKVKKAVQGCHYVVHMAAIVGVNTILSMPVKTMEVSLLGTYNVLKALESENKIERFIDFSTSEVFGSYAFNAKESDSTTLGEVGEVRWTYAVSKLATEHLTLNYHKEKGLPALSIRPFNIYGPRQVVMNAVPRFVSQCLSNKDMEIHNDGSQIRSWCYINDIVEAILLCLQKKEAVGHAFNIGNPRSTCTIYHLAQEIKRLSGSNSRIVFKKWKFQDIELRVPDIGKARKLLGYEPKVDLEEGLLRSIHWYRNHDVSKYFRSR